MLVPCGIGSRCDPESLKETDLDSRSVDDDGIVDSWLVSHGNFFSEAATTICVRRFFRFNGVRLGASECVRAYVRACSFDESSKQERRRRFERW